MEMVNLTPHALTVITDDDTIVIPASGTVARCAEISTPVGSANGIPLKTTAYGNVSGLPAPKAGTLYIVSALVRLALPGRTDLASPGDLVRDSAGQIVGARSLIVNE